MTAPKGTKNAAEKHTVGKHSWLERREQSQSRLADGKQVKGVSEAAPFTSQ